MEEKSRQRYSILESMSMEMMIAHTCNACYFFSPINNDKIRNSPEKAKENGKTTPFSVNDYFIWREKEGDKDLGKRRQQLVELFRRMESSGLLCFAGANGFSMGGERCYYFFKEVTLMERQGCLWLGRCLGLPFIYHMLKDFIIHITGKNADNDEIGGTGTLIAPKIIVTCAHVILDMAEMNPTVSISGVDYEIETTKTHEAIDVGFIQLKEEAKSLGGLAFREGSVLESILIFGYPKIPQSAHAPLVVQSGEICGEMNGTDKNKYFLYSAIARPGDSGGCIVSENGNILGIMTSQAEFQDDKNLPFFVGIPTSEIIKAANEINVSVPVEDFS